MVGIRLPISSILKDVIAQFKESGIRVSFCDPDPKMVEAAATTGTDRIELYTEATPTDSSSMPKKPLCHILKAEIANQAGLGLNDLDLREFEILCSKHSKSSGSKYWPCTYLRCVLYYGLEHTIKSLFEADRRCYLGVVYRLKPFAKAYS